MKRSFVFAAACGALSLATVANAYDNLWAHLSTRGLSDNEDLLFASNTIVRVAKAGLKEVVWPGLDAYWLWSDARKARFEEVKRIAEANGIGIVPLIWSTGYGTMTGVDASLIESVLMQNMPYVAKGGNLVPEHDTAQLVKNGGFETPGKGQNTFAEWYVDHPGSVAFLDTQTFHSGKTSIRMEPGPDKDKHGHARMCQRFAVKPGRLYRVSAWFKIAGVPIIGEALMLQIYLDKDGKATWNGGKSGGGIWAKDGWCKMSFEFQTGESNGARVWCGTWGAKAGIFWVDDVSVEEVGLRWIALRDDSPRTVRSAATGKVYEKGKDWQNPPRATNRKSEIVFPLPKGSAIKEGEKVLVDTYAPSTSGPKMQISTCMSDPHLYELFRKSAETLEELLHPKKWFLSLDEVRNGGTCALCSARNTDMAHILAGCVLKQHEIIRSVHPGAEIYAWSDMFDPFHNAKDRVCGCKGTFKGIWDLIPHDVIMVLWYGDMLGKSIPFFTERGFRVMGSVCCDSKKTEKVRKWKKAIDDVPGSKGFMYTTWRRDFDQVEDYAKIILEK